MRVEQVKEWCVYISTQIHAVLGKEDSLRRLTSEQVQVLLQLPVESLKQLFQRTNASREELCYQVIVVNQIIG